MAFDCGAGDTVSSALLPFLEYANTYTALNPTDKVPIVLLFVKKTKETFKPPDWLKRIVKRLNAKTKNNLPKGRLAIVPSDDDKIAKRFNLRGKFIHGARTIAKLQSGSERFSGSGVCPCSSRKVQCFEAG